MIQRTKHSGHQTGVMLIEAMLAILIFSIGVLGIIGLQAAATKASADARYRSEASLLANEIIGRMWATNRTLAKIAGDFADPTNCPLAQAAAAGLNPPVAIVCTSSEYRKWAWEGVSAAPGTATAPAAGTVLGTLPLAINAPPSVQVTPVASPLPLTYPATDRIPRSLVTITIFWQPPGEDQRRYTTSVEIGG